MATTPERAQGGRISGGGGLVEGLGSRGEAGERESLVGKLSLAIGDALLAVPDGIFLVDRELARSIPVKRLGWRGGTDEKRGRVGRML